MIKHKGNQIIYDKNNNIKILPQGELNKIIRYLKICNGETHHVCKYVTISKTNIELIKLIKKDRLMKNTSKFTPKEDEHLMMSILKYGLNFKKISRLFKKTASDLKWRYQKIQTLNKIFNFQNMHKNSAYSNIIDSILYDNANKEYNDINIYGNGNYENDIDINNDVNGDEQDKQKEDNHFNNNIYIPEKICVDSGLNEKAIDQYNINEDISSNNSYSSIETFQQRKFKKELKEKEVDEKFLFKKRENENLIKSLMIIEDKLNESYENLVEMNGKYNNNISEEVFYIKDDIKRNVFQEKWKYIDVVDSKIGDYMKKFLFDMKNFNYIDDLLYKIEIILSIIRLIGYKEKLYNV